jgi:UbiD family decarboxylase
MNRTSSLGEFLEQFRRYHPQDVFVVDDEVDVEYESTAYYKLLEEKNPVIWFSKVKGYPDFQLVTNIMGSRARMAFALGLDSESRLYETWNEALNSKAEIRISDESRQSKNEFLRGRMSTSTLFLLLNTIPATAPTPGSGDTSPLVWPSQEIRYLRKQST